VHHIEYSPAIFSGSGLVMVLASKVPFFENALTCQLMGGGASARFKRFRKKSAGMTMVLLMLWI
jgi:hypothetical protein